LFGAFKEGIFSCGIPVVMSFFPWLTGVLFVGNDEEAEFELNEERYNNSTRFVPVG